MKYTDLMLDLETLDSSPTSVILSIAAVPFNMNGEYDTENAFERYINIQSCLDKGLTVSQGTFLWWLSQSDEARASQILAVRQDLRDVLTDFSSYYNGLCEEKVYIWGNGAAFDLAIMRNAFDVSKIKVPWLPKYEQDCRTVVRLNHNIRNNVIQNFQGVAHNAKDDCINQIQYITEIAKDKKLFV